MRPTPPARPFTLLRSAQATAQRGRVLPRCASSTSTRNTTKRRESSHRHAAPSFARLQERSRSSTFISTSPARRPSGPSGRIRVVPLGRPPGPLVRHRPPEPCELGATSWPEPGSTTRPTFACTSTTAARSPNLRAQHLLRVHHRRRELRGKSKTICHSIVFVSWDALSAPGWALRTRRVRRAWPSQ
jgi:hypothetical protein